MRTVYQIKAVQATRLKIIHEKKRYLVVFEKIRDKADLEIDGWACS